MRCKVYPSDAAAVARLDSEDQVEFTATSFEEVLQ
jgi:hypothetical protein